MFQKRFHTRRPVFDPGPVTATSEVMSSEHRLLNDLRKRPLRRMHYGVVLLAVTLPLQYNHINVFVKACVRATLTVSMLTDSALPNKGNFRRVHAS
jgi:hypothetical protein